MVETYYIIIFAISFLITARINYHNNSAKIQKLLLRWNKMCFHIHHWITFGVILFAFVAGRYINIGLFNIVVAIIFGIIAEGFLFKDVFSVSKSCKKIFKNNIK